MSNFKGNTLLGKVVKARWKYEAEIEELQEYLEDKIEFQFAIDWQADDGHMIGDEDGNLAPIASCLSVIYTKGSLSEKDHSKLCI